MATATTKKTTGFSVICPHCFDTDAMVSIDLNLLSECRCSSCDETFSAQDAVDKLVAMAERWEQVVRWIDLWQECDHRRVRRSWGGAAANSPAPGDPEPSFQEHQESGK
jgi:hypothetical protein